MICMVGEMRGLAVAVLTSGNSSSERAAEPSRSARSSLVARQQQVFEKNADSSDRLRIQTCDRAPGLAAHLARAVPGSGHLAMAQPLEQQQPTSRSAGVRPSVRTGVSIASPSPRSASAASCRTGPPRGAPPRARYPGARRAAPLAAIRATTRRPGTGQHHDDHLHQQVPWSARLRVVQQVPRPSGWR